MPRGPKRRRATPVLACLGLVLLGRLARADPSPPGATTAPSTSASPAAPPAPLPLPAPPFHVAYAAPEDCPTEAAFKAAVQGRTAFARFADEPDARAVHVVVRATRDKYAGHLSIVGRSGRVSERDVEDALCSNVVDALALVTALAIDPKAMLLLASPPDATSAAPLAPPLDASSPNSTEVTPSPVPPPPARPQTLSASPRPGVPHAGSWGSAPKWGAGAGASFVTMSGIAPDAIAGGGGFGELESKSSRWFAPSVRLTVLAAENGVFMAHPTASYLLLAGRADVCPLRLGLRDWSIRPCVAADVGAVRAEGNNLGPVRGLTAWVAWFDAAALLRARWTPGRRRFFIEAEGGILIPITQPDFGYTDPNLKSGFLPQDRPDKPGAAGSLAAGLRFW